MPCTKSRLDANRAGSLRSLVLAHILDMTFLAALIRASCRPSFLPPRAWSITIALVVSILIMPWLPSLTS